MLMGCICRSVPIGVSMARKLLGRSRLIGVSSHSPPDVSGAAREGADFAVFGPVFIRYPNLRPVRHGVLTGLKAACRAGAIPVFALGGMTADRTRECSRLLRTRRGRPEWHRSVRYLRLIRRL